MRENTIIIWMNVTTSLGWKRPPVGIVRVERSLCAELARIYGSAFKCCVWLDGDFVECPVPLVDAFDGAGSGGSAVARAESEKGEGLPWIFPLLSRRQAVISIGQGLLSIVPERIRPHVNRLLYRLRPHVIRWSRFSILKKIQNWFSRRNSPSEADPCGGGAGNYSLFSPGDVVISVGLDWDQALYKDFYSLRKLRNVKVVTCCYDLIPVIYPQYCVGQVAEMFTSYFIDLADGSDLMLCISRQSEKDLLELLDQTGGARPATHVFPLGDNVPVPSGESVSLPVQQICNEPFVLFVSTIERRKNHEVLYRAYHLLCKEGKQSDLPRLVFVGMQGWGVGDFIKDIELDPLTRDYIVRFNHVTDAELRTLYDAALFCVFPSLYEGWGLPVGEALSIGKAVICSDQGSLPEVGGDLVRYVHPWDPRAWADEIHRMATDHAWRLEWEQKVKAQYKVRTWSQAAESVAKAIESIS